MTRPRAQVVVGLAMLAAVAVAATLVVGLGLGPGSDGPNSPSSPESPAATSGPLVAAGPTPATMAGCTQGGVAWPTPLPDPPYLGLMIDREQYLPGDRTRLLIVATDFSDAPAPPQLQDAAHAAADEVEAFAADLSAGAWDLEVSVHPEVHRMAEPLQTFLAENVDDVTDPLSGTIELDSPDGFFHESLHATLLAELDDEVDFNAVDAVVIMPLMRVEGALAFAVPAAAPVATSEREMTGYAVNLSLETPPSLLLHEALHLLGLPDLYDTEWDPAVDQLPRDWTLSWDLMSSVAVGGLAPMAWQQWQLGWVPPERLHCVAESGTWEVLTGTPADTVAVGAVMPTSETTALVVETRRAVGADANACRGGVLVYQIDLTVPTGLGPVRVVDAVPGETVDPATVTRPDCTGAEVTTLSAPSAPDGASTWTDPESGMVLTVLGAVAEPDLIQITRP